MRIEKCEYRYRHIQMYYRYTLLARLSEFAMHPCYNRLASEFSQTHFSSAMQNLAKWLPRCFNR